MSSRIAGLEHWRIDFDEHGNLTSQDDLVGQITAAGVTDLFVFCHGWNNSEESARSLYERFFGELASLLSQRPATQRRVAGTAGVFWPSLGWADEDTPGASGAAAMGAEPPSDRGLVEDLRAMYREPEQQEVLAEIADLLERKPEDDKELRRFQELLHKLAPEPGEVDALDEAGAPLLLREPRFEDVLERLGDESDVRAPQGGAGLGSAFGKLWAGAKEALRQTTYWEMKKRAGQIGTHGLGSLVGRLHAANNGLRIHLQGHSFGARLVAFALRGLPDAQPSPVKSVLLVQGAFSQFAFASSLPHDSGRSGALADMADRVDGPIAITHSVHDGALARLYPLASMAARDDAAGVSDLLARWGAIGHLGAQAVQAAGVALGAVGTSYPFATGKCTNLNSDNIIRTGGGPSGAHSDIFHAEVAWAALAAAGIA